MGTLYDPNTSRDAAAKARGRERVMRDARGGTVPDRVMSDHDIAWMFDGHEPELAEARRLAAAAQDRNIANEQAAQEREIIRGLADQIEKEWQQAAKRAAYAEAVRRYRARRGDAPADADEDGLAQRLLAGDA